MKKLIMVTTFGYALALPFPQQDKKLPKHQPIQVDEDTIPDSLLVSGFGLSY